jgi:hypothetical protein
METGVAKSESRAQGERNAESALSGFLPWSVTKSICLGLTPTTLKTAS